MLEKPAIADEKIVRCLKNEFGLAVDQLEFLPLGADLDTAVYRVEAQDKRYFLKLRSGQFNEASVTVPNYLYQQGLQQIIPTISAKSGQPWAHLGSYRMVIYPFVAGQNGYEIPLSDAGWVDFGRALKRFHTTKFPAELTQPIRREMYSPRFRETVLSFLARIDHEPFSESLARQAAEFLHAKRTATRDLVQRAQHLASHLQRQPREFILCHADIHAWNLLIRANGDFYMVDWDTLIFAPKERDLMFIGGGLGGKTRSPQEEETLFYRGYGQTNVDSTALAYYRYERIVEDIAIICEHIFLSDDDGEDRQQALGLLKSNYRPNGTIDIAYQTDRTRRSS